MGTIELSLCSEIAQITFFAFAAPVAGGGRRENVIFVEE